MSLDNPLWGAPRIHGELLRIGFEVAQSQGSSTITQTAESTSCCAGRTKARKTSTPWPGNAAYQSAPATPYQSAAALPYSGISSPVAAKPSPMPAHQRLRSNDLKDVHGEARSFRQITRFALPLKE